MKQKYNKKQYLKIQAALITITNKALKYLSRMK